VTTQSTQLADAAQLLHDAQTSGIPISPLTQTYPNLDVAQAYSVQRLNLARFSVVHEEGCGDRADRRALLFGMQLHRHAHPVGH
jgi:2-keto-4-pentenoate hydratase